MKKKHLYLSGLLVLHLFFLLNLRFTAWPEMFSFAYLRNNGFLVYGDMIHPYPPVLTMGLSYIYSILGHGLGVLKGVTWLIILANDVLIFLVAKELTKSVQWSAVSVLFYVLLQPFLEGNQLWFDLAIVTPLLLGTLFLLRFFGRPSHKVSVVTAGLFFGVATLIKQTAALFLIFGILYIVYRERKIKNALNLLVGPLVLVASLMIRLIQEGALTDFINWTLIYPLTEWGKVPGYVQMSLSKDELVVLVLLVAPVVLLLRKVKRNFLKQKDFSLILLFLILSFVMIYPRFSFFHFQIALAYMAIAYGYLARNVKVQNVSLISYLVLMTVVIHRPVLARDWQKEARFYGREEKEMAQIISKKVPKDERTYLLGLHSGLYVMADRLPPKRWTDNFGWYLEILGVQEEIIGRWEENPPKAVFWQDPSPGNWFDLGTYQPKKITEWIEKNYTRQEEVKTAIWLWERRN